MLASHIGLPVQVSAVPLSIQLFVDTLKMGVKDGVCTQTPSFYVVWDEPQALVFGLAWYWILQSFAE